MSTQSRRFASPLIPIFLVVAVDVLGFTLILPFLPFYAEHYGASPMTVGLITSSFAICQFIAGPILGRISDRVGRKPTLLVSQIGSFVGFLVLGGANALWLIFLARIIDGFTAGNLTIAQAYISDVTKPEERTKAFALIGIAFGSGFVIGPPIAGFLSKYGYQWPAYAAAGLSLLSIIGTITLLPKVPRSAPLNDGIGRIKRMTQYFERPMVRRHLLEFLAFTLSFATMTTALPLYLERQMGYDAEHTGYIYAFSGVIGAAIQGGLIGRLVKRLGEMRLAIIGFITMAIGYSLLGYVNSLAFLLILTGIGSFGGAVVRPCLTTLITRSVGRHEQGAALGVSQSLASIAQILGPLIGAFFIEHGEIVLYGFAGAFFSLAGGLLALSKGADTPPGLEGREAEVA